MKRFILWHSSDCPNCKALEALLKEIRQEYEFQLVLQLIAEDLLIALQHQVASAPGLTEINYVGAHHKIEISYDKAVLIENMGLGEEDIHKGLKKNKDFHKIRRKKT